MESISRRGFASLVLTVLLLGCAPESRNAGESRAPAGRRVLASADEVAVSNEELPLAVHYIAFTAVDGDAVASQKSVEEMLGHMSKVWSPCHIGFRLDRYEAKAPGDVDARYNPANYYELDEMRMREQAETALLIMGTGSWNRTGDLGNTGSNCFSSFPGDDAEGIVCEYSQASSSLLMSHEVGHWLNLIHTDDPYNDRVDDTVPSNAAHNLMNHFVSPSNNELTPQQCQRARYAIASSRASAVLN